MKKMNNTNYSAAVGTAVLLLIVSLAFTSCPPPFESELVKAARQTVNPKPDIVVLYGEKEIPDGGSSDAFLDAVEGTPWDVEYIVQNRGNGSLKLRETDTILFNGNNADLFSLLESPGSITLKPGEITTFTIRFQLDSAGEKTAVIAIYSDDPEENPYEFTLSNTSLPKIQVSIDGTIQSGDTYDFNELEYTISAGGSSEVSVSIENLGKAVLKFVDSPPVTISGSSFELISQPSSSIEPGGLETVDLRFVPTGPGQKTGTFTINTNDTDETTFMIELKGSAFLPVQESYISSGTEYSLAIDTENTVWVWGSNSSGELGLGFSDNDAHPIPASIPSFSAVAVSTGIHHNLALGTDGNVWAWGWNNDGNLGDGTRFSRFEPVELNDFNDVVAVSAGLDHSVALKKDGSVWTWGSNRSGQLGYGYVDSNIYTSPDRVSSLDEVVAVAAGRSDFTLVLKSDGTVWSWGENDFGQLGNGSSDSDPHPSPSQVINLSDVVALDAGRLHSLALKSDGTVWAWGNASMVGDGSETSTPNPLPTKVNNLSDIIAIRAGDAHSIAVESDGTTWVWGYNQGRLGDGSHLRRYEPVVNSVSDAKAVDAGDDFSLFVRADGTVSSCGYNDSGQLGDGTIVDRYEPVQITPLRDINTIAAGSWHSLTVDIDGNVWGWGANSVGQVGNGTTALRQAVTQISSITDIIDVSAGHMHSLALKSDGTVWSWGYNTSGQLGIGNSDEEEHLTPTSVLNLSSIEQIASGNHFNLAIDSNGSVWGWGDNDFGQILNESPSDIEATPVESPYFSSAADVAAGTYHSLVVLEDGTVWACGRNADGQLGLGDTNNRYSPVQVTALSDTNINSVAASYSHSLALDSDGNVYAWGDNSNGQLGDGSNTNRLEPVQVSDLSGIVAIDAGDYFSLALKSDGTLWAWGDNWYGSLGNGDRTDSNTPVQTNIVTSGSALAAGSGHGLSLNSDGTVYAWGQNDKQQLGDGTITTRDEPVMSMDLLYLW